MKNTMKKLTVLLAATFALMACGDNKPSSQSKQQSNNSGVSTSSIVTPSSDSTPAPSSSTPEPSSSTPAPSSSDTPAPSSSTPEPSSSTPAPSSSTPAPSSSSPAPSSSSAGGDTEINVDDYIIEHTEGSKVKYIFEAECTDLRSKTGLGYSGGSTASGLAVDVTDDSGQRACVTFLYIPGISLNFFVASDRDVSDAKLSVMLGAEFIHVLLDPTSYQFRVDQNIDHAFLHDYDPNDLNSDGCLGNWEAFFLNYYTVEETDGYYINEWECETIDIDRSNNDKIGGWQLFDITLNLSLKKGINCISMITSNNTFVSDVPHGTMAATAPVVDYLAIETTAQLGVFNAQDNAQGTNACYIEE